MRDSLECDLNSAPVQSSQVGELALLAQASGLWGLAVISYLDLISIHCIHRLKYHTVPLVTWNMCTYFKLIYKTDLIQAHEGVQHIVWPIKFVEWKNSVSFWVSEGKDGVYIGYFPKNLIRTQFVKVEEGCRDTLTVGKVFVNNNRKIGMGKCKERGRI